MGHSSKGRVRPHPHPRTLGRRMDPSNGAWFGPISDSTTSQVVWWDQFLAGIIKPIPRHQRQRGPSRDEGTIKLKWPEIDQYANNFERLTRVAGSNLAATKRTIEFFIEGLQRTCGRRVLRPPVLGHLRDHEEKAIQSIKSRQWIEKKKSLALFEGTPNPYKGPTRLVPGPNRTNKNRNN